MGMERTRASQVTGMVEKMVVSSDGSDGERSGISIGTNRHWCVILHSRVITSY